MGLCIEFKFRNGCKRDVNMCYSSFSNQVMSLQDMKHWGFNDHSGLHSDAKKLNFLISCLITAGYLETDFKYIPELATFC